jgi:twitching motility protein PilJ
VFVALNTIQGANRSAQTQVASDALMHSQRIGKAAPNAVQGSVEGFRQLEESRKELNKDINLMTRGGQYQGRSIGEPSADIAVVVAAARKQWTATDRGRHHPDAQGGPERHGQDAANAERNVARPAGAHRRHHRLKVQRGASAREIAALGKLTMLTQRMSRSAGEFLTAGGISSETAFQLGRDTTVFRNTLDGFLNGSPRARAGRRARSGPARQVHRAARRVRGVPEAGDGDPGKLDKFNAAKAAEQLIFNDNEALRQRLACCSRLTASIRTRSISPSG